MRRLLIATLLVALSSALMQQPGCGAGGDEGGDGTGGGTVPGSPPIATLAENPEDPMIAMAETPAGNLYEFFGTKDSSGRATDVTHFNVRNSEGVTRFALDSQGRPETVHAPNGTTFQLTWTSSTGAAVTAISPSGNLQVTTSIDLGSGSPPVARKAAPRPSSARLLGAGDVHVNVDLCGVDEDGATVWVTVAAGSEVTTYPADRIGAGAYRTTVPTVPSYGATVESKCQAAAGVINDFCSTMGWLDQLYLPRAICIAISAAVEIANPIPGDSVVVLSACSGAFEKVNAFCDATEFANINMLDLFCDTVRDPIDHYYPNTVLIQGVCEIPGVGNFHSNITSAPGDGPFPTLSVTATSGPRVSALTAAPANPAPHESYVATAALSCLDPSTTVRIEVRGTDGYFGWTECVLSGAGTCPITVLGGALDVTDTITVLLDAVVKREIVVRFQ